MKKICALFFCVILLFACAATNAEEWNGIDTMPKGVVLCESLSLRKEPSVTSDILTTLSYGSLVYILGDLTSDGEWYEVVYTGERPGAQGFVKRDYIMPNPEYYTTSVETPVYAIPSLDAKRVGLLDPNQNFVLLYDCGDFYCISLRGASGFVIKQ